MKLVHINLNEGILVDAINCTEWVIESPEYFSEYVMELAGQVEGKEGRFVLSDNEKEVDISKNVELIFNIFALDINERKLISKLYMELEKHRQEILRKLIFHSGDRALVHRIQECSHRTVICHI